MAKPQRLTNPDSWNPHPLETEPMFAGQDTHPLSQDEMKAFYARLDIRDNKTKIKAAFVELAKTPTGREQMREIINAEPKDRKFIIEDEDVDEKFGGAYFADVDRIAIPDKAVDECTKEQLGNLLLHELSHARYVSVNTTMLFADAETQALTAQLGVETKDECSDTVYRKNYQDNLKEWRLIAEGKKQPPKWAKNLPFKYQPSAAEKESGKNDPVRVAKAREMYARKMASMQTRTAFMEDFYSSENSLAKGYKSSKRFSYAGLGSTYLYRKHEIDSMDYRKWCIENNVRTPKGEVYAAEQNDVADIHALGARYPSLNKNIMLARAADIKRELEAEKKDVSASKQRKGVSGIAYNESNVSATNIPDEIVDRIDDEFEKIGEDASLSDVQKEEKYFQVYVKNQLIIHRRSWRKIYSNVCFGINI